MKKPAKMCYQCSKLLHANDVVNSEWEGESASIQLQKGPYLNCDKSSNFKHCWHLHMLSAKPISAIMIWRHCFEETKLFGCFLYTCDCQWDRTDQI